jgi:hypothetical protein
MREAERRILDLMRRQHGLVTRAQALDAGLSVGAWGRRLATGEFVALHRGIARHPSQPTTDDQRILAAVLAVGPPAQASHTSAARVWGAGVDPWEPEVLLTGPSRSSRLPGVVVHRATSGPAVRSVLRRRIPVTDPLRTLSDLASLGRRATVEEALSEFVRAQLVTPAAVHRLVEGGGGKGRRGIALLREVVERWSLPGAFGDSTLEVVMAELCAAHGLPTPSFHHRVGPYELDVAFPEQRVAVELDSWRFHGGREAFEADRARDLALQARGWVVSRVTWLAVTTRPSRVAAQLLQVLDGRSAA